MRAAHLVKDDQARRRVLTVRGRTGAVLLMAHLATEAADHIAPDLSELVRADVREQVQYMAAENTSSVLFYTLGIEPFPRLLDLHLDLVNLAIVYQTAYWGNITAGQKTVGKLHAKLIRVGYDIAVNHWGVLYTGMGCA